VSVSEVGWEGEDTVSQWPTFKILSEMCFKRNVWELKFKVRYTDDGYVEINSFTVRPTQNSALYFILTDYYSLNKGNQSLP